MAKILDYDGDLWIKRGDLVAEIIQVSKEALDDKTKQALLDLAQSLSMMTKAKVHKQLMISEIT